MNRLCATLIAVALTLPLAATATAAELGGSSFQMSVNLKLKVRGESPVRAAVTSVLSFDGLPADQSGTCRMEFYDRPGGVLAGTVPCTWESRNRRRFTLSLDDAALADLLNGLAQAGGIGGSLDLSTRDARGVLNPRSGLLRFAIRAVGSIDLGERSRRFDVKMLWTGTEIQPGS